MIRHVEIMTSDEYRMQPLLPRSVIAFAVVLTAGMATSAFAQNSASGPSSADLQARCDQLISMYDRYGAGRSENSDGARNHTEIGARIDCSNGRAAEGVAAMEDLLRRKKFDVPPPPAGVAQSPTTINTPRP
jgi:hypothetical protein